jgi:hypothetical protein
MPSAFKQGTLIARSVDASAAAARSPVRFHMVDTRRLWLMTSFALVHPEAWTTAGQCIGVDEDAAGGVHGDSTLQRGSARQTDAHSNAVANFRSGVTNRCW